MIRDISIGFVVVIGLVVVAGLVMANFEFVCWLATMLTRPVYLARLRHRGVREWTLQAHSEEYVAAYLTRQATNRDDRQLITRIGRQLNYEADRIVYVVYRILVTLGIEQEETHADGGNGGRGRAYRTGRSIAERVATNR